MTTRKTGRHVEIEPDWEAAFNLQMRMMPVYSLVYDWCFSDVSYQFSLWLEKGLLFPELILVMIVSRFYSCVLCAEKQVTLRI